MLERESLDIVSVCTPLADRGVLIRALIDSGRVRGILAEKPFAESVDEAASLASRAGQAGVIGAVNYVRRYAPGYRAVAHDMRDGALGSIQIVRAIYTKGVLNNGGHLLDLLRLFFGDPSSIEVLSSLDEQPGDPTVSCRLSFSAGFDAWVTAARHSACAIFDVDIVGTSGRVVFGDLGHRLDRWRVDDTTAVHGFKQLSRAPETTDPGLRLAIAMAIDNLAECLEGGSQPLCTFEDGTAALALALSVRDRALASAGLLS